MRLRGSSVGLPGEPALAAGSLWVPNQDGGTLSRIDPEDGTVQAVLDIHPGLAVTHEALGDLWVLGYTDGLARLPLVTVTPSGRGLSLFRTVASMDAAVPERGPAVVWTDADFDLRFSRLRGRLVAVCTGLVGAADAEDIVHDTYLRARRSVAELRDADAFDAWLTRIAINLCYSRHQRARTLRGLLPSLLPSSIARSPDLALRDLIERLPPRERTILVLHYGHGYRLDEIAELLSLTAVNVRAIVSRTRRRLATEWRRSADG